MPLHLDSFVEERKEIKVFSRLLALCRKAQKPISPDGVHIHMSHPLINKKNKKEFGRIVYTLKEVNNKLNIIDADIIILSDKPTNLIFDYKPTPSSEANEYYNVVTADDDLHFQIETVNRYFIKGDIEGTTQTVWLSAFPFRIDVYDDIKAFNKENGFENITTKDGSVIHGFSEEFIGPNLSEDSEENPYTFMLGKVKEIEDIKLKINTGNNIEFKILYLKTGIGIIPAVVSDKVFDLSNVKKGKLIAMSACIKVDFLGNKRTPLEQIDLNIALYKECEKTSVNYEKVKKLLKDGANPLGTVSKTDKGDYLYGNLLWLGNKNIYELTKIFLENGMKINHSDYDPAWEGDSIDPLWNFGFMVNSTGIKTLKLLLDNGLDVASVEELVEHLYIDYFVLHQSDDYEYAAKMILLCASYEEIVKNSEYIQDIIDFKKNDYDLKKLRDYDNCHIIVNGKTLGFYDNKDNKLVWKISF